MHAHFAHQLHKKSYDIKEAVQELVKSPVIGSVVGKRSWSKENAVRATSNMKNCYNSPHLLLMHALLRQVLFAKGMRQFGKNFYRIKKELLPNTEIVSVCVYVCGIGCLCACMFVCVCV